LSKRIDARDHQIDRLSQHVARLETRLQELERGFNLHLSWEDTRRLAFRTAEG